MSPCIRTLYRWDDASGQRRLERDGWISEARLRAWEYEREPDCVWTFSAGEFHDTVRRWTTRRPDLQVPAELLVGDHEQVSLDPRAVAGLDHRPWCATNA